MGMDYKSPEGFLILDGGLNISSEVAEEIDCAVVKNFNYSQRCSYIKAVADCQGKMHYVNYIKLFFCNFNPGNDIMQALYAIALLSFCWILFIILATTVDSIFCPALKVIAIVAGMNEHLAGATLVAFGGSSPDVLSTLGSVVSGDAKGVFSELIAGCFYVGIFLSSLIIVLAPFELQSYSTIRDVAFLLFAILYIDFAIRSNECISILESSLILFIYVVYIAVLIIDQVMLKKQLKNLEKRVSQMDYSGSDYALLETLRGEAELEMFSRGSRVTRVSVDISYTRVSAYKPNTKKNENLFRQFFISINPLDWELFQSASYFKKAGLIIRIPVNLMLFTLIPIVDYELPRHGWSKLLNCIQIVVLPIIICAVLLRSANFYGVPIWVLSIFLCLPLSIIFFMTSRTDLPPKGHVFIAIFSCAGSALVIYICGAEVIQILYVIGVVSNSSEGFLSATLLAWGMAIGDLVSNVILALNGYQRMGYAACFGSPMFNSVLIAGGLFLLKCIKNETDCVNVPRGELDENCVCFTLLSLVFTMIWMLILNCQARRCVGIFTLTNYDWERSLSEPDLTGLTDPFQKLNRFIIKHPHEYISVDDLKYFRRKKPPDHITKSNICLYGEDEKVLPFSSLKSEYRSSFHELDLSLRPHLLRRSTSLRLEGLMHHLSEHHEQYHWYNPNDWQSCRGYPIKNPENLRLTGDISMIPEYRSSYISYPMVDRTMKILPREVFQIEPHSSQSSQVKDSTSKNSGQVAAIKKLSEDKIKRDVAAQDQKKCHLRRLYADTNYNTMPSEYKRQFVQFPIEKAHSIPQLSHIQIQGKFGGVPEYQDSYKMYANYSKSAPIKKFDNLTMSGAERPISPTLPSKVELPEYREKFCDPPKDIHKEKALKTNDHLRPQGEFSKVLPEYYESFRDPQVKALPERGKCREPYLRLKGKIEFNPEYRNTYLDFPRARPIVKKPVSSFRLPMAKTTMNSTKDLDPRNEQHSPRYSEVNHSTHNFSHDLEPPIITTSEKNPDITATPEYRRAMTHYQLRERTPTRKIQSLESDGGGKAKFAQKSTTRSTRKSSDSSFEFSKSIKPLVGPTTTKRRPSRHCQASILENQTASAQNNFENVGQGSKKTAKFGRRASVLQNAANCRENSSIVEGNPKYASHRPRRNYEMENRESFLVLDEPCKRSNWMKKSWYDS